MNGYGFLGHLVKAIGYAVVNGAEEGDSRDQPGTRARATRRAGYAGVNTSTKGKKCCTAKREANTDSGKAASAPIASAPGTSFGTVPAVRRGGRR